MRRNSFDEVRHIPEPIYAMLPEEPSLEDGVLYIVDGPQYAEYNCPCGCGTIIMIPYFTPGTKGNQYGWELSEKDGKATLSPSVYSKLACGSHYFIRQNRIDWCG